MIQLAQHCFWSYPPAARQVCNLWNWLWPLHWLHRIEDEYVSVCISGVIGETFSPDYRPPQMADFAIHTDMVLYVLKFVLTFIRSSRLSTSHLFDTDYTTFVMSTLLLRYWELYDIKYIIKFRNARLILCMRNLSVQRKKFWTSRINVAAHLVSSV